MIHTSTIFTNMQATTTDIIARNDELMKRVHEHLDNKLHRISTGRASPVMLESVRAEIYGQHLPLAQMASVNTPDARTIIVQPWDKTAIEPIEMAIKAANLGLNPSNNGERIIVPIPVPTEERRKELVKSAHAEGEHARVSIRNLRHEAMNDIKAMKLPEDSQKDLQGKIEKLTTEWNNKVAALVQGKEVEIMKV